VDEASNLTKILSQIENLIALFRKGTKGVLEELQAAFMRLVKLGTHLDDSLSCSMQLVLREALEPSHLGAVKIFELLTGIKYKS
jgi:accessory gene regulator protein AgrB